MAHHEEISSTPIGIGRKTRRKRMVKRGEKKKRRSGVEIGGAGMVAWRKAKTNGEEKRGEMASKMA